MAGEQGIERSEDVVALIMMVMAAAISAYALYVYLQRSKMLKEQVEEVPPTHPPHKHNPKVSSVSTRTGNPDSSAILRLDKRYCQGEQLSCWSSA